MKFIFAIILLLALYSCRTIQEENSLLVINTDNALSFEATKDLLDKEIKSEPESDLLYFKRAQLFLSKKYLELALTDVDKAIKFSHQAKYYFLKSRILFAMEDTTGLDYCLRQYEKTKIEDYEYYDIKSELLLKKRFYRNAIAELNTGLSVAPFYNPFYKKKGLAYLALKDTAKGEKYLKLAYEKDSSIIDNYFELARFYQKTNQKVLADKFLRKGLERDSLHYGVNLLKGNLFYKAKKFDSALVYYNKSVSQNPNYEESVYQRAKLYMDMFRFIAAQSDWQKVLRINANNDVAQKNLAICYLENNEISQAETLLNIVYQRDTSNREIKGYMETLKNSKQKSVLNRNDSANLRTKVKIIDSLR